MKYLYPLLFAFFSCLMANQLMAQDMPSSLEKKNYGNIVYMTGGIGDEERDEIRSRERDFNLKLLFAERDGSYLGDVDVVVLTPKGESIFDVNSVGPFLLMQLPAGSYVIKTSMNGQTQQKRLAVSAKGRRDAIFRW